LSYYPPLISPVASSLPLSALLSLTRFLFSSLSISLSLFPLSLSPSLPRALHSLSFPLSLSLSPPPSLCPFLRLPLSVPSTLPPFTVSPSFCLPLSLLRTATPLPPHLSLRHI